MKKHVRSVGVMLVVVLLAGLVAACASNKGGGASSPPASSGATPSASSAAPSESPAAPSGELTKVKFVAPGSEPTEADKRFAAINEKLKADGVGIQIEYQYIGWDAWEQKTNLMLSTGEAFDNMTIMEDLIKTSVYVGRGALLPIDEYLDKYPSLKEKFAPDVWEGMKINGKIYGIPVLNREWANDYELISYRSDLAQKHNLQPPTTIQETIDFAQAIKKAENNPNMYFVMKPNSIAGAFHREYDSYPFNVVDDLIYIDQAGNVKSWIETEEFKKDNEYFNQLYTKGLIHPDILTLPLDQVTKTITDGDFAATLSNAYFDYAALKQKIPELEIEATRLAPDKKWMRPVLVTNANVIPKTSKNPEGMIKFFDWLYSNQENFDLLVYGIKDDWWKDAGPNKLERLRPVGNEAGFSEWQVGYAPFTRIATNAHPKLLETMTLNTDALNAPNIGFTFDTTPVAVEYANLLAEIKTSVYPMKLGVVKYDDYFDGALKKMKSAGLDKVVAEYKKQFDAWKASQ